MNEKRYLYCLVGFAGLFAWLVFILGCTGWPAWSPDGSKILFPYFDPDSQDSGIAVYDRGSGTVTPVFRQVADDKGEPYPFAQWLRNGKRAALTLFSDNSNPQVFLLPLGDNGSPMQHFVLPNSKELSLPPYPEIAGSLFVGATYIARLNLATGKVEAKTLRDGESARLLSNGDRIWYVLKGEKESATQVGELNPETLDREPLFEISDSDTQELGIASLDDLSYLVPDHAGSQFALPGLLGEEPVVLLFNRAGQITVAKPVFPERGYSLGLVDWALDNNTVYAAALGPASNGKRDFMIAEIPIEGGAVRLTRIASLIKTGGDFNGFPFYLQPSLSPDGHTLATSTGYVPKGWVATADRALYLMNLGDPGRHVSKVPIRNMSVGKE